MTRYPERDELLKEMGYASYAKYLKSELWLSIKQAILTPGLMCCVCQQKPAKVIHHRSYAKDVMLGINKAPLAPVCGGCHIQVERRPIARTKRRKGKQCKGALREPHEVEIKFKRRQRRAAKSKLNKETIVDARCSGCGDVTHVPKNFWRHHRRKCKVCGDAIYLADKTIALDKPIVVAWSGSRMNW